jgi:hypothetical protein
MTLYAWHGIGADGCSKVSPAPQANFSRAVSITFHRREITVTFSPSFDSVVNPQYGRSPERRGHARARPLACGAPNGELTPTRPALVAAQLRPDRERQALLIGRSPSGYGTAPGMGAVFGEVVGPDVPTRRPT